jgi:hypothetical protein
VVLLQYIPPIQVRHDDILNRLDILLHLDVDLLTPAGQVGQSEIPVPVAGGEHGTDIVKSALGTHPVCMAADGDEVVGDAFFLEVKIKV